MKFLKKIAIFLYRMWFYLLLGVPIIIMSPIILISVSRASWYPFYYRIAQFWARTALYGAGFIPRVKRVAPLEKQVNAMYIANHTSIVDIMLMLHCVNDPFVFVGKKELARFPLFGYIYKRTCILVDRRDMRSRRAVFESAENKLEQGLSICIFPEGRVPDDVTLILDTFKDGAFRLALEHGMPIVPLVFYDNKKRFSYTKALTSPGQMRAKVLPAISTAQLELEDRRNLRNKCHDIIKRELEKGPGF